MTENYLKLQLKSGMLGKIKLVANFNLKPLTGFIS